MKNNELLILRHGKSEWPDGVPDHSRPLKGRGRKNALRIGLWLIEQQLLPDYMLSSSAARALGTAEKICDAIGRPYSVIHEDARIYEASVEQLLQVLHEVPESAQRVLLIGHNPGLEHLLIHLCPVMDIPDDGKLLPTATLAHLYVDSLWSQLADDSAQLQTIVRPRSLPEKFPVQTSRGLEYRERPEYFYTQSAALPYRMQSTGMECLLVTTRRSKRWTLPKGIVAPGTDAMHSAQQEAMEEAGAIGDMDAPLPGSIRYAKWGGVCTVTVFPMRVQRLLDEAEWSESYRLREWVSVDRLDQYIKDDTLLDMMRGFANRVGAEPSH